VLIFAVIKYGIDWQGFDPSIYFEVLIGYLFCYFNTRSTLFECCDDFENIHNEVNNGT
jgi:hypothetical protein